MHEHDLAVLSSKLRYGIANLRDQRDRVIACGSAALPLLSSYLRRCAGEEMAEDAIECAELIAAIGGEAAATGLIDILVWYRKPDDDNPGSSDDDDELWRGRTAVERGLRVLGSVAVPHLRPLLVNENRDAARSAAKLLAEHGDLETLETLLAWAIDRDEEREEDRWAALEALGGYRDPRAVSVVLEALSEPEEAENRGPVVRSASRAIASIGDQRGMTRLCALLGDSDPSVRWTACEALGRFDGDQARAALRAARNDPNESVRAAAAAALGSAIST